MSREERIFVRLLENYRRNRGHNPSLEAKIVKQKKDFGTDYILSCISKEARRFCDASRAVACEIHRAHSYLRFEESTEGLIGKADFEHNIIEPVLEHFMRRFPREKIILISDACAFVAEGGKISKETAGAYTTKKQKSKENSLWEAFYDSQYIETRRNRRLAMQHIPKKLWKRFEIREAKKIDSTFPKNQTSLC